MAKSGTIPRIGLPADAGSACLPVTAVVHFGVAVHDASGNNSVVECDLAKVEVAGSNPVSRSNFRRPPGLEVTIERIPPDSPIGAVAKW